MRPGSWRAAPRRAMLEVVSSGLPLGSPRAPAVTQSSPHLLSPKTRPLPWPSVSLGHSASSLVLPHSCLT